MENSYYYPGSAISYFLGTLLLTEKKIIIITPWVGDVPLIFPLNKFNLKILSLSEYVNNVLVKEKDCQLVLITTKDEWNFQNFLNKINIKEVQNFKLILKEEFFHSKAIVSDSLVYEGSANITKKGFFDNKEICKFFINEFGDVDKFIREKYYFVFR
jgi:phosphatidylserine/phosphatidylglycerophosphate/cardiolipin synthase-like enzyme